MYSIILDVCIPQHNLLIISPALVLRIANKHRSALLYIGPDGQPILRVDGPHSIPSEHYLSYNTVMIIGAGIGMNPYSILRFAVNYCNLHHYLYFICLLKG